jgi:hypothetical protein
MFSSLDEQIETTEGHPATGERLVRFVAAAVVAVVVIAVLYLGIVAFE